MTMQVNGTNAAEKEELVARYSSSYGRSMIGRLLDAADGGLGMVCFFQGLAMSILSPILPSCASTSFGIDSSQQTPCNVFYIFSSSRMTSTQCT